MERVRNYHLLHIIILAVAICLYFFTDHQDFPWLVAFTVLLVWSYTKDLRLNVYEIVISKMVEERDQVNSDLLKVLETLRAKQKEHEENKKNKEKTSNQ